MAKVKLFAPVGTTGCSFDGDAYLVAEDGTIEVPEKAVETLTSHGFATSREEVGKVVVVPSPEAMAQLGAALTAANVEIAQLRGSVEAMKAERDEARAEAKKRK